MSVASATEMLLEATEGRYAVGAFNITSIVQMKAVLEIASDRKAPVIIQTSVKPSQFYTPEGLVSFYRALAGSASVPVVLHLDHCTDGEYCKKCAAAGYTNIMIDASKNDFAENVRRTREVSAYCHSLDGISVEGELGTVSGVEDQVKVVETEALLCDPQKAVEFVESTGIDLFAPAIGTAHGIYTTRDPRVDFQRLEKIFTLLNGKGARVPLVIHGGTGLPPHTVQRLISLGGAKFNVSTELKHTLIDTTWDYIGANRKEYDPGKLDEAVRKATMQAVDGWIGILGSAGKV